MKAFPIFLILIGILGFLSIFGMMSVTFGILVGIFFAFVFTIEGIRELINGNLVGIGSVLFSIFIIIKLFFISMTFGQLFMAFIASYAIAIGFHMLFKRRERIRF